MFLLKGTVIQMIWQIFLFNEHKIIWDIIICLALLTVRFYSRPQKLKAKYLKMSFWAC